MGLLLFHCGRTHLNGTRLFYTRYTFTFGLHTALVIYSILPHAHLRRCILHTHVTATPCRHTFPALTGTYGRRTNTGCGCEPHTAPHTHTPTRWTHAATLPPAHCALRLYLPPQPFLLPFGHPAGYRRAPPACIVQRPACCRALPRLRAPATTLPTTSYRHYHPMPSFTAYVPAVPHCCSPARCTALAPHRAFTRTHTNHLSVDIGWTDE